MWLEFFSASALTHQEKLYPVSEHPRPPFLKFLNCHTGFITLSATIKVSVQNHTKLLSPEVFENEKNTHQSKRSRSDRMNSQTPQVLLSNRLQIELPPKQPNLFYNREAFSTAIKLWYLFHSSEK